MKLHDLPARPEKPIRIYGLQSYRDGEEPHDSVVLYHHIDGLYSYCHVEGYEDDGPVHLSVATPLVPYKDGYKVVEGIDD